MTLTKGTDDAIQNAANMIRDTAERLKWLLADDGVLVYRRAKGLVILYAMVSRGAEPGEALVALAKVGL